MKRKLLEKLKSWRDDPFRKPLLLDGARQVGKTYLVEELFSKQFSKFVKIDFRIDSEVRCFIKNHQKASLIINYLELKKGIEIDSDTLLFFDEAQECIPMLTAMKYFCQDYPQIPVVVTGSYVRLKLHQMEREIGSSRIRFDPEIDPENQDGHNNFLYPVGKIDELSLYGMTFDEFLLEANPKLYDQLKRSYEERAPLIKEYHELSMDYFYKFMMIGGMPEAVDVYLKTGSAIRAQKTLKTLYGNYLGDMSLYQISSETIVRTKRAFDSIYLELNKPNKNFKISTIEYNKRFRDYASALAWLEISRLIVASHQLKESLSYPLFHKDEALLRIYLADLGLFCLQSGVSPNDFVDELKRNSLSGIYFENYFAIEANARNLPLFYWEGKTSSELEFILARSGNLYPVDVKKNKGSLASLEQFRNRNRDDFAIKVSANQFGYDPEKRLLTLPLYYVSFFLDEFVDEEKRELLFTK